MEALISVHFTAPSDQVDFWEETLTGLCAGKRGAWLERRFGIFGPEVTEMLDAFVEYDDRQGGVVFEDYENRAGRFQCTVNGGHGAINHLQAAERFLIACRLEEVRITTDE